LLPHTTNYKKDWKDLKLKKYDWVFTHNTFDGAQAGNGIQLRGIPKNLFGKARVISGDIHIPQRLTPGYVEYVGSPYLCDFGDRYEPRVLLIDDGRIRSIPVTGPQKRLVEITSLTELKKGSVNTRYLNEGDILKVRMLITGEQRSDWPNIRDTIRMWGHDNGYQIHVVQPVMLDTIRGTNKPKAKHVKMTDEQLLRTYAKHRSLDQLTLKAGMNLCRKV